MTRRELLWEQLFCCILLLQARSYMFFLAGSSNGRTRDFESRYEGPTPSPAAKLEPISSIIKIPNEPSLCLAMLSFFLPVEAASEGRHFFLRMHHRSTSCFINKTMSRSCFFPV